MLQKKILEQPGAFQHFFDHHPEGIIIVDFNGKFLNVNTTAINMFGYSREELMNASLKELLDVQDFERVRFDEEDESRFDLAIHHKKGYLVYVRLTCLPLVGDRQKIGWFMTFEDITVDREQSKILLNIQDMFAFISKKSQNIISSLSPDGVFTYISPTVESLLGYTPEEVIGRPSIDFNHPDDQKKLLEARNSEFIDQDTVRFTGRVRHKDGDYRWYETTVEYIRNLSGDIMQRICVGRDITARKEAEETVVHMAFHDTLTNLPNRRLFNNHVKQLLEENKDESHGLMLIDLDEFKHVNDTFGHDIGDLLLIEAATRLTGAVGDRGLAARWGGDEFTVICPNIKERSEMMGIMEKIRESFTQPFTIAHHSLSIAASIGFSISPGDGDTLEVLCKKADIAMYKLKPTAIPKKQKRKCTIKKDR